MDVHIPVTDEEKQLNADRRRQGLPYWCNDPALFAEQHVYQDKMTEYNRTMPTETDTRQALLKEMFAEIGDDCIIETPVNANWGCHNVHLGSGVYINSGVTFVDDADIFIGDSCLIGTGVTFCTAGHPVLPELRENDFQYELPIRIGRNVWIGSSVIIMPGITIGDNSVIGAGSVVTRDIPANVVAYGVPCKVQREIGDKDKEFYCRGKRFPRM
ncbi:MAG: sugar O-acetyltransferase [Clostridia bacterium]|nr:sugar O-acetyltransferase [Clostridia bacterium]